MWFGLRFRLTVFHAVNPRLSLAVAQFYSSPQISDSLFVVAQLPISYAHKFVWVWVGRVNLLGKLGRYNCFFVVARTGFDEGFLYVVDVFVGIERYSLLNVCQSLRVEVWLYLCLFFEVEEAIVEVLYSYDVLIVLIADYCLLVVTVTVILLCTVIYIWCCIGLWTFHQNRKFTNP